MAFQEVCTKHQIESQVLRLNSKIRINDQPIIYKNWLSMGIQRVGDIIDTDGNVFSRHQIKDKYNFQPPFTEYYGIIHAMPPRWKHWLKDVNKSTTIDYLQIWLNCKSASKLMYQKINSDITLLNELTDKWKRNIDIENEEILKAIRKINKITMLS